MKDDALLSMLTEWVEEAEDATIEPRKRSELDRNYYDGVQWTDAEVRTLKQRGQPVTTDNRIKRKIDYLTGLEKIKRTDPKAFPRNPQDESASQAATDALRYVWDNQNGDSIRSDVWEHMLVEGFGGAAVEIKRNRKGRVEVALRLIPWDRLFYDPTSARHDFSDARYMGEIVWMDFEVAKAKFPDSARELEMSADLQGRGQGETYDDKPRWIHGHKRKRVKIVTCWYRDGSGNWSFAQFTANVLIKNGPSPFMTEDGTACPLILVSAYVQRDNERQGVVRDMRPLQDEVNKRRSKLLHNLIARQIIMDDGAVDDEREVRRELSKPDGVIKAHPGKRFEILANNEEIVGHFNLLADIKADMDQMGPNAALTGRAGEEASGRAILASQQGGQTEIATLLDRLRWFNIRMYRAIWDRVQQFWTEERWIRVTDDERNMRFVGLNRQVPAIQLLQEKIANEPPAKQQQIMALAQQDPRSQQMVSVNTLADLDVDIIVEDAPDTITIMAENFDRVVQLAQAGVQFPPDVLIEMMPGLRNREQLLDRMRGGQSPEQAQAMQEQQELARRGAMAEIAKTEAEVKETNASALKDISAAAKNYADARAQTV
jgi:hypothetical protein